MTTDNTTSNLPKIEDTVDAVTRARIASLYARGLVETQIADVLMLTVEQVVASKGTEEYKTKYAEEANRIIEEQIDRDEGWDAVEAKALAGILDQLEYMRDPKYMLAAAQIANKAERRTAKKHDPRVIDNSRPQTNIIMLTVNKNYIEKPKGENGALLDITPKVPADQIPLKQSDLPSPKAVEEMLAPVKTKTVEQMDEVEKAFAMAGVVFDTNE